MIRKALLVYGKEMRVMRRDRRLVLGVTVTSLVVMPALMGLIGRVGRLGTEPGDPVAVLVLGDDAAVARALDRTPGIRWARPGGAAASGPEITVFSDGAAVTVATDRTVPRLWDAARRIEEAMLRERDSVVARALRRRGVDPGILQPFAVDLVDTSDRERRGAALLGALVPYLVIVLLVANAIRAVYVAAGDKEKNTLASLLVCDVPRPAIVIGKTLTIMSFAVFASVLLVAGMVVFANIGLPVAGGELGDVAFRLSGRQVLQLSANITALALLVSAIIMVLGTIARSQREAGVYTSPLLFLSILLAVFSLGSADFGAPAYAVPFLGNSLAMRDAVVGALRWERLAIAVAANAVLAAGLVLLAVRLYERETVLFRR